MLSFGLNVIGIKFMCLAVPSKIIEINDTMATVDVDG
ncbi:MAG: HypC/HybG/HupF family hydrogenase formation chaperone, partial [Desulfobacteraceae bacterium]|nr:HypC/HybG/HupF family hydrogenase formation chaperone [Desulfobacteraceae bacterium]